jgi:hypothetical protein
LFKSLILTRKRKGKRREKTVLNIHAKELFQFIRDQEAKEKMDKQKLMKINRTFLKHTYGKSSFESSRWLQKGITFRLVDAAERRKK